MITESKKETIKTTTRCWSERIKTAKKIEFQKQANCGRGCVKEMLAKKKKKKKKRKKEKEKQIKLNNNNNDNTHTHTQTHTHTHTQSLVAN